MSCGRARPRRPCRPRGDVEIAGAPDISVVVVTYQSRRQIEACLGSLYGSSGGLDIEVVVLDNASGDGTAELVAERFPLAELIASPTNLGFAAAVNEAASVARGRYLLLLNPDTVVHEGSIERLLEFAEANPEHGLYGGRTLAPNGEVDPSSCWGQPTVWSMFCFAALLTTLCKRSRLFDPESLGRWERDSVREVGIVTGCLLLVPTALWRELGGFDPTYFMYAEDADLALRARAKGLRPAITPDAVITHEVGGSSEAKPEKLVLVLQGKSTLIRKRWSPLRRTFGLAFLATGVAVRAAVARAVGRGGEPDAWRAAWRARRTWFPGYSDASRTRAA